MPVSTGKWLQECTLAVQAAALDESLWPAALATIGRCFGSSAAAIETWDHRHEASWSFISHGLDVGGLVEIKNRYPESNPRLEDNRDIRQGEITYDYKHHSETELNRSAYIRDLETFTGTRYFLAGVPLRDEMRFAGITLFHEPRQRHFGEKEAEALKTFLPILHMAIKSSLMIGTQRVLADLGMHASKDTGVILLDARCNPIFMNAAAERLFGSSEGRMITAPKVRRVMNGAVRGLGGACVWDHSLNGRSYEVVGIPVDTRSEVFAPLRPKAVLLCHDPRERCRLNVPVVRDLFDLTQREIEVSESILAGTSVECISRRLGIAESTVRVHLRTILLKTDTHSQVALAARLRPFMQDGESKPNPTT